MYRTNATAPIHLYGNAANGQTGPVVDIHQPERKPL